MEGFILKIFIAAVAGYLIGFINLKNAPARMFSIICMGAALVTVTSIEFFKLIDLPWYSDPGRLCAQVISALGFIGTGLIWITDDKETAGISVAANLWITAIIGIFIGVGLEAVSAIGVLFLIIIYYGSKLITGNKRNSRNKYK